MRANRWPWVAIAALAGLAVAALGWQQHTTTELRRALAGQRAQGRERARLQTDNQRLVAAQATAAELETLLAERAAVTQLRAELEALRRRANESAAAHPAAAPGPTTPPLTGNVLAHHLWKNLGRATPAAAFETALWAAAGGNLDALAGLLAFDPEARSEAAALFDRLPATLRQEFVSPERLVAALTAKDVPLGSATILGQYPSSTETRVAAQIFDAEGKQKVSLFSLRAEGDHWQLIVPAKVVRNYSTWLHTPLAAAKSAP